MAQVARLFGAELGSEQGALNLVFSQMILSAWPFSPGEMCGIRGNDQGVDHAGGHSAGGGEEGSTTSSPW